MLKYKAFLSVFVLAMLLASCNLLSGNDTTPTATQEAEPQLEEEPIIEAPPMLEADAKALHLPGRVVYSIRILNPGDIQLGNVSIHMETEDASLEALNNFLSVTEEGSENNLTWTLEAAPAKTLLGPFAAQELGEDGQVTAVVRWETPTMGEMDIPISVVENASQTPVTVQMTSVSLNDLPGSGHLYGAGDQPSIYMPVNEPTEVMSGSLFTDIAETGISYYVPQDERGAVTIERLALPAALEEFAGQVPVAAFRIDKEKPGSLILTVPLDIPVTPFSLVRVFADSGGGFVEEAMMGSVTGDGMHAVFSADHETEFVLTVSDSISAGGGAIDLGEFHADGLGGTIDGIIDMISNPIIGSAQGFAVTSWVPQHASQSTGWEIESDFLGHSYQVWGIEMGLDPDGDGISTGDELYYGTDPHDSDTDGDGINDYDDHDTMTPGDIHAEGDCPTIFCFQRSQGSYDPSYLPESDGSSTPSLDNVSGGAVNGISDDPDRFEIAMSTSDLINIAAVAAAGEAFGEAWEDPDFGIGGSFVLRTVVVVGNNWLGVLIPGGQPVRPVLGLTPYLRMKGYSDEPVDTESVEEKPTETNTPTEVIGSLAPTITPTTQATVAEIATPTKVPPTITVAPTQPDTTGPKVSGPNASPNPALTTTPVTISATISDGSGVTSATLFYKTGKDAYQSAGTMSSGGGNLYSLVIGPLTPAGTYQFRIRAIDSLGNANCSDKTPDSCPGGSFVVNIP